MCRNFLSLPSTRKSVFKSQFFHFHADFEYLEIAAHSVTFHLFLSPQKSFFVRLEGRHCCVFLFPSLRRASVFVIALNKGWLAARFDAGGWSVIITPHAGSADGGGSSSPLPSKPPSPCSASAPRLGANCPRCNPTRRSALIIPFGVNKCGCHRPACRERCEE